MAAPFYAKGNYVGRVTGQGFSKVNSSGNTQFLLKFTVIEKADGTQVDMQYERTVYRAITENTIEYFISDLQSLGFEGESFTELDPGTTNHHSFVGQDINVFCNHETGQDGSLREKWGISNRSSKPIDPMDQRELRKLDSLFGRNLKSATRTAGATRPARQPQPAVATAEGINDDDIPF